MTNLKIKSEPEDLIFYGLDDEILRLTLDGRIVLRGEELAQDATLGKIVKAYCRWVRTLAGGEG